MRFRCKICDQIKVEEIVNTQLICRSCKVVSDVHDSLVAASSQEDFSIEETLKTICTSQALLLSRLILLEKRLNTLAPSKKDSHQSDHSNDDYDDFAEQSIMDEYYEKTGGDYSDEF